MVLLHPAAGTATPSADYTGLPTSVTISAGEASATFALPVVADGVTEAAESVGLCLRADAAYRLGAAFAATGTITDAETSTNHPPHAVPNAPQPPTAATVGQQYTWNFAQDFADEDVGDVLHYTLIDPTSNATLDSNTGSFSWTPAVVGNQQISFVVDDGHAGILNQVYTMTVDAEGGEVAIEDLLPWPRNVEAVAINANKISLSWNATTSGLDSSYRVYRSQDPAFEISDGEFLGQHAGLSFDDDTVSGSTRYYYRVIAVQADGSYSPASLASSQITQFDMPATDLKSSAEKGSVRKRGQESFRVRKMGVRKKGGETGSGVGGETGSGVD